MSDRDWYAMHGIRPDVPEDPAFLALGGRYINKRSVSQVRLTDGHAAVWLHGHVDPIHVDGAGAQAVRDWIEEMFA